MARELLKIQLDTIHEDGLVLEFGDADAPFAAILAEAADGAGDVCGATRLTLEQWPERVDVTGTLTASVPQICVRCLNPFVATVQRTISQVLVRKLDEQEDEEAELTAADLDRTELTGDAIDLAELLHEELQLALPLKPLCAEGCKGICPGCGAELNEEECTCEPEVDPRWEVLKGLKLGE